VEEIDHQEERSGRKLSARMAHNLRATLVQKGNQGAKKEPGKFPGGERTLHLADRQGKIQRGAIDADYRSPETKKI